MEISYFEEYHKEKSLVVQVHETFYSPVFFHFPAVEENKGCVDKITKLRHIYSCVQVM